MDPKKVAWIMWIRSWINIQKWDKITSGEIMSYVVFFFFLQAEEKEKITQKNRAKYIILWVSTMVTHDHLNYGINSGDVTTWIIPLRCVSAMHINLFFKV